MRHNKLYLALMVLAIVACNKEHCTSTANESIELRFKGSICNESAQTKSSPAVTEQLLSRSIGIYVCDHGTYNPHGLGLNNVIANASVKDGVQSWSFTLNGITGTFPALTLTAKEDKSGNNITADIFAYGPYKQWASSPECIPFNVGDDMIYPLENADDTVNKNIDPTAKNPDGTKQHTFDVDLHFRHVMSLLQINLKILNPTYNHPGGNRPTGSDIKVVMICHNDDAKMYSEGWFNSITGELYNLTPCESLEFSTRPTAIIPTQAGEDYEDGDYIFKFIVEGQELKSEYTLTKDDIKHKDSDEYGFKPGYSYVLNFTYDNFVRLDGITIAEWKVEESPLYEIEI